MKKARRFCSSDKNGIFFCRYDEKRGRYPDNAVVKIKNVWFLVRLVGEKKSLLEILYMFNSLRPIKAAFSYFGVSIKECFKDNAEVTLRIMKKRCQEEIERTKSLGYTTKENIADWWAVLSGAGKNPPEELRQLLETTIAELEKIGIKKPPRKRKLKESEIYYRFR